MPARLPALLRLLAAASLAGALVGCTLAATPAFAAAPDIFEPTLTDGKATISLPGEASSIIPAGAGRYLVIHMKKIESLAILDLCQARVTKIITLPKGESHVAAGLTKVFVASESSNSLTRYSLPNLDKEVTTLAPEGSIQWLAMGSGSVAPLIVANAKKTLMMDPTTFQSTPLTWGHFATPDSNWPAPNMRLSGDGRTLLGWGGGWAGIEVLTIDGAHIIDRQSGGYIHAENPRVSFDGALIFAGNAALDGQLRPTEADLGGPGIPAANSNYFLSLHQSGNQAELRFFLQGSPRALWTLKDAAEFTKSSLPEEERIFFLPQANLLAVASAANNQILLRRFNIIDALNSAGIDYLFISSTPDIQAAPGGAYAYQMQVQSKRGSVECALAAGPDGMKVSKSGAVSWHIPAATTPSETRITLSATDATKQIAYQTFIIHITPH